MTSKEYQPLLAIKDAKFNTKHGKIISLLDLQEETILIEDIANALSFICRFGGHTCCFYSVGHHSTLVAELAKEESLELQKVALLHDASEAYLGDIISPLKHLIGELYFPIEERFMKIIFKKFEIDYNLIADIKKYDIQALKLEFEAFQREDVEYQKYIKNLLDVTEFTTDYSQQFLQKFNKLWNN